MSRADFYDMRLGEFFEAMDAFRREQEAGRQHTGNLVRGLAIRVVNLFVKAKYKSEQKFWPMPWDAADDAPGDVAEELAQMTDEERQAKVNEFLSKLDNVSNPER